MAPTPKAPPTAYEPKLFSRTHPRTPEDAICITGKLNNKTFYQILHESFIRNLQIYYDSIPVADNNRI